LIALFLAWIFVQQGFAKFSDTSGWAKAFRMWHYPVWFRVAVGVAELAAAILVLIPPAAFAGGVLIMIVMLGGMATHVWWGHPGQVTSEIVPLLLATATAFGRRKAFFPFRPRGPRA
jgi:uncharacterized membrane protein YphA (DoxX/SURF4 family)